MSATPDKRAAGLALLLVLWITALLAIIAATVLSTARSDAVLTANRQAIAEAELAAEGGLRSAIFRHLADPAPAWQDHGSVFEWRVPGAAIRAKLLDESGRVDLNAAEARTLAAVIAEAGADTATAQGIARRIVAARGGNDAQPFRSTDVLVHTDGVTPALMSALAPLVTVHTADILPDMEVAPPPVRAALRKTSTSRQRPESVRLSTVVRLVVEARTDAGYRAIRAAVVLRLTDGGDSAYRLLWWGPG